MDANILEALAALIFLFLPWRWWQQVWNITTSLLH